MKRIYFWFWGVENVIQHRRPLRTFCSRAFNPNLPLEERDALEGVIKLARREGFTPKDLIKSKIVDQPDFSVEKA
jgi:hypothetical protein